VPKPTFDNLPAEKRQLIIDLALAEFAEHPYQAASLSRIVERAAIAKGSVYQYFAHKQDLYLFLLDYAAQRQLELLRAQTPPEPELGFFALLRWQIRASVAVGLAAPLLTRLLYRAHTDDLPFRDEVARRLGTAGDDYLQAMLADGAARGELEASLDPEVAAFVLRQLLGSVRELLLRRLGITLEQAASDVTLLSGTEAEQLYAQVMAILQYGLAPHRRAEQSEGAA
jgi:AcrR family transcriptional regulator